jgi:restriction system protein
MTVCRINRNNAEDRIKHMAKSGWHSTSIPKVAGTKVKSDEIIEEMGETESDLELLANDQIAKYLIRKFKGHGMAVIIEAILKAKGYTTYRSPEGADKGVDILAAPEPMGFGKPRLCVQVKTGDGPIDRPTLDQLIGAMQNFNADQGLLVSWSGFKSSVDKEIPNQFFRVRLWSQKEIVQELLQNYDKLDDDVKSELPLKKMWALSITSD